MGTETEAPTKADDLTKKKTETAPQVKPGTWTMPASYQPGDKSKTGAKGGASGASGPAQPTSVPTVTPSVADPEGRFLWHSCVLGDYVLPPDFSSGAITVDAESKQKIDKKGGAGKDKTKKTKQGKEDVKIKVHCEWTVASWGDGVWGPGWESILFEIDPNTDTGGGPYAFSHPDTNRRGVKNVLVEKVGKVEVKGHHYKCEIELVEWVKPTADNKGGGSASKTPDKPTDGSKWTAKGTGTQWTAKTDAAKSHMEPAKPTDANK